MPSRAGAEAEEARITRLTRLIRSDPSFKVRTYAARRLGDFSDRGARNNPEILTALREALRDEDHIVRGVAAEALGRHGSPDSLPDLERMERTDENPFARSSAIHALELIHERSAVRAGPKERPPRHGHRVELGRVLLAAPPPLANDRPRSDDSSELIEAIRDTLDDLLEPHRPAIFPREDPEVRLDVTIYRVEENTTGRRRNLSYEARVVILQLPGANLRHASNAKASTQVSNHRSGRSGEKAMNELERKLAVQATTRAVSEALALLDAH